MSSHIARIEVYPNNDEDVIEDWSYGCPDLDLMGYSDIQELLVDIKIVLAKKLKEQEKLK